MLGHYNAECKRRRPDRNFKREANLAHIKRIKKFHTDRGVEFCSSQFTTFCEDSGIVRHYPDPYHPQQNGMVERKNRTIVVMARSFLKAKEVPPEFWGEAVSPCTYLTGYPHELLQAIHRMKLGLD